MKHKLCEDGPRAWAEKLAALQNLNVEALKQCWRELYRTEPPVRISPSLLLQAVAYRLQEQAWAGSNPRPVAYSRRSQKRATRDRRPG